MSLLAEVVAWLRTAEVPHCLIGAAALAVHGAARSTQDDDLLVVDRRVLEAAENELLIQHPVAQGLCSNQP